MALNGAGGSRLVAWLRTTDWLWMIIGGFYLVAYLFWFIPALAGLPRSVRDPPERFPWHWPLDFVSTALSGSVLLLLGFRRATEFTTGSRERGQQRSPGDPARSAGGDPRAE